MLMTEGGEGKLHTNINFLLEEFGVMANSGEISYKLVRELQNVSMQGQPIYIMNTLGNKWWFIHKLLSGYVSVGLSWGSNNYSSM